MCFQGGHPSSYLLPNLLGVLLQALLQLVSVGAHAAAGIVAVLLHHRLELPQILGAAVFGFCHVLLESVEEKLHVLRHLAAGAISVGRQLGLDVFSVLSQLGHGVGDQSAERRGGISGLD